MELKLLGSFRFGYDINQKKYMFFGGEVVAKPSDCHHLFFFVACLCKTNMLLIALCHMKAISTCHTSDGGICIYTYILTLPWRMGDSAATTKVSKTSKIHRSGYG